MKCHAQKRLIEGRVCFALWLRELQGRKGMAAGAEAGGSEITSQPTKEVERESSK